MPTPSTFTERTIYELKAYKRGADAVLETWRNCDRETAERRAQELSEKHLCFVIVNPVIEVVRVAVKRAVAA